MYDTQWLNKCLSCTKVVTREKKKPSHMSHDLVPHKLSQRPLARQQCASQLRTQKSSWKVSPQIKRKGTVRRSKQPEKGGARAFKPLPPSCFFLLLLHSLCRDYIFPLSINFKCILFSAASAGSSPCAACARTRTHRHTLCHPSLHHLTSLLLAPPSQVHRSPLFYFIFCKQLLSLWTTIYMTRLSLARSIFLKKDHYQFDK